MLLATGYITADQLLNHLSSFDRTASHLNDYILPAHSLFCYKMKPFTIAVDTTNFRILLNRVKGINSNGSLLIKRIKQLLLHIEFTINFSAIILKHCNEIRRSISQYIKLKPLEGARPRKIQAVAPED